MTERQTKTAKRLLAHVAAYPELEARDLLKYVYQSAYGCEHLLSDGASVLARIEAERDGAKITTPREVEELDGKYARVGLGSLSAKTLARLFMLSARREDGGDAALAEKLEVLRMLASEGQLPCSARALDAELDAWREAGYPPISHSDSFRLKYSPSYRVILKDYARFIPLLSKLDAELSARRVTLAIEGCSASGKTTLAGLLEELYDCTVFHADDYFLRPEQRTRERLSEPGGNLDRERLESEILLPLSQGKAIAYRPYNCSTRALDEPISVMPRALTVIEGAYSMHPDLEGYYGMSVFLEVDPEYQKRRIKKRNSPEMAERFFNEWIPLERKYFDSLRPKERCSLSIKIEDCEN